MAASLFRMTMTLFTTFLASWCKNCDIVSREDINIQVRRCFFFIGQVYLSQSCTAQNATEISTHILAEQVKHVPSDVTELN